MNVNEPVRPVHARLERVAFCVNYDGDCPVGWACSPCNLEAWGIRHRREQRGRAIVRFNIQLACRSAGPQRCSEMTRRHCSPKTDRSRLVGGGFGGSGVDDSGNPTGGDHSHRRLPRALKPDKSWAQPGKTFRVSGAARDDDDTTGKDGKGEGERDACQRFPGARLCFTGCARWPSPLCGCF